MTSRRKHGLYQQQVAFPLLCPAVLEVFIRLGSNLLFANSNAAFSENLPATSLSVSIALVAFACKHIIHDFKPLTADEEFENDKRWYQVLLDYLIFASIALFIVSIVVSTYGQSIRSEHIWNNGDTGVIVVMLLCVACAFGLHLLMRDARTALRVL